MYNLRSRQIKKNILNEDQTQNNSGHNCKCKTSNDIFRELLPKYKCLEVWNNQDLDYEPDDEIVVPNARDCRKHYISLIKTKLHEVENFQPKNNKINACIELFTIVCFWLDDAIDGRDDKVPDEFLDVVLKKCDELESEHYSTKSEHIEHYVSLLRVLSRTRATIFEHYKRFH